jgi:hypothetical protein
MPNFFSKIRELLYMALYFFFFTGFLRALIPHASLKYLA